MFISLRNPIEITKITTFTFQLRDTRIEYSKLKTSVKPLKYRPIGNPAIILYSGGCMKTEFSNQVLTLKLHI